MKTLVISEEHAITEKTHKSVKAGIAKYTKGCEGKPIKLGTEGCGLCKIFFSSDCRGCPIAIIIGSTRCNDTPYPILEDGARITAGESGIFNISKVEFIAKTPKQKQAMIDMRDLLIRIDGMIK